VLGLLYRVFASFPKNEVVDDKSIQFRWGFLPPLTVQKKYSNAMIRASGRRKSLRTHRVHLMCPPQVKISDTSLSSGYSDLSSSLPSRLSLLHVSVKLQSAITAFFLHPRRLCHLLPQFVQHLPGLFPNPSTEPPTGSLIAPQVVPGRDKGTHERDRC
jgi:hypothetical protein